MDSKLQMAKFFYPKHKNQSLLFFGQFVGTVLKSGSSLETKLEQITVAWTDLSAVVDFNTGNVFLVSPPAQQDVPIPSETS